MLIQSINETQQPFQTLRKFVRAKPVVEEKCELCGALLGAEHQHLIEPAARRLRCACDACAILFSGMQGGKFRRVPRRIEFLNDFQISDGQWEGFHIPINLAFFFFNSAAEKVVAIYPSPAGATESLLSLEEWQEISVENSILQELEPDVEALLVNRIGQTRQYFRVPIDECYKLVGLLRAHWHGLSGGAEVWGKIAEFFAGLKARAVVVGSICAGVSDTQSAKAQEIVAERTAGESSMAGGTAHA